MFRDFFALFAFVPVFAFATWHGSHDQGIYPDASSCLAAQKASWDRRWREFVGCRTWADTGWSQHGDTQSVGSLLGGCAAGGVVCTALYVPGEGPGEESCSTKIGTSVIVNVTSGWKKTPKVNDESEEWVYTYRFPPSGTATICGGSNICEMTIDAREPCTECGAYVSQVAAANGLHRVSTDFRGHFTGKTCNAASESDLPPDAVQADNSKDPPCPGYVGEVNGVRGCYGTASNPVRPVPPPEKPPGHGGGGAGNPTAGTKPSSGEGSGSGGSGRTPSTGAGGSGGGPAGAAAGSGTKPDGTTPKPDDGKEQAHCGAPGQPKCGIDEGGTPSKFEGDKAALDGWKSAVEANRNTIKDADGSFFDSYSMFFAVPPIVPCEPIELPNDQLLTRQCDVVEGTRSVMSYIWALAAIWICLGWIREAI